MKPMAEETRKKMPTMASTPRMPSTISLSSWFLKMMNSAADAVNTMASRMMRSTVPGRVLRSTIGI